MPLSNDGAHAVLNALFGGVALGAPSDWYFELYTVAPTNAGGGTVVSTGVWTNYARATLANNATNFDAASGRAKDNDTVVDFGTAAVTGTAPVVVAIGFFSASTGGTFWAWALLASSVTVTNGAPVTIPIGDLDFNVPAS